MAVFCSRVQARALLLSQYEQYELPEIPPHLREGPLTLVIEYGESTRKFVFLRLVEHKPAIRFQSFHV